MINEIAIIYYTKDLKWISSHIFDNLLTVEIFDRTKEKGGQ